MGTQFLGCENATTASAPYRVRMRSRSERRSRWPARIFTTVGEFTIGEGQSETFRLTGYPSHEAEPGDSDPLSMLSVLERAMAQMGRPLLLSGRMARSRCQVADNAKGSHLRTNRRIVAAPTTSLPECLGGPRNWDYRFCWLRDSTFTLYALLISGYIDEARAWREWLLRAIAGHPQDTQIMYGIAGERMLTELELPWLTGL